MHDIIMMKKVTMTSNFPMISLYKLVVVAILLLLNIGSSISFIPIQQQQSIQISFHHHQHQSHSFQYNTVAQQIGQHQNQNQKQQLTTNQIFNSRTLASHTSSSKLYGGLFGLGFLEIGIILVGVGVVIGPAGIASVAKAAATRTSELTNEMKTIPKEFQDGLEIGETEARSRKAKRIVVTKSTRDNDSNESSEDK